MNEQSDTPRTDAIVNSHVKDGPYVTEHHDLLADFARTLERELNKCVWDLHNTAREVMQLRSDLKMCAEALKDLKLVCKDILFPAMNKAGSVEMWLPEQMQVSKAMQDTEQALNNPRIQAILNEK